MNKLTSEKERGERIAEVKRQLGSPKTSPQKRRDLTKYLNRLRTAKVEE